MFVENVVTFLKVFATNMKSRFLKFFQMTPNCATHHIYISSPWKVYDYDFYNCASDIQRGIIGLSDENEMCTFMIKTVPKMRRSPPSILCFDKNFVVSSFPFDPWSLLKTWLLSWKYLPLIWNQVSWSFFDGYSTWYWSYFQLFLCIAFLLKSTFHQRDNICTKIIVMRSPNLAPFIQF